MIYLFGMVVGLIFVLFGVSGTARQWDEQARQRVVRRKHARDIKEVNRRLDQLEAEVRAGGAR